MRMVTFSGRRLPHVLVLGIMAVLVPLATGHSAVAAATRSGDAEVVEAANRLRPVTAGTHESPFSIRLPQGATCPGDSMNDDWRVQTFVVPSTDDPGSLRYMVTGPEGPKDDARVALYTTEGRPYVNQLLGANSAPGQPGQIIELPAMSFRRLPIDYLPTGEYRVGVACTDYQGVTAMYWDTTILIESAPDAMSWKVLKTARNLDKGSNTIWIIVAVACGVVFAGSVVTFLRASRAQRVPADRESDR